MLETGAEMSMCGDGRGRGSTLSPLYNRQTGTVAHPRAGAAAWRLAGRRACAAGRHAEECNGRRLPVSGAAGGGGAGQRVISNAYDKAGFLSFMEYGGFDLRQVEY